MLTRIRELLRPPVPENEEDALASSLLHTILIIFLIASLVVPLLLNIVALLDPNDEIPFELSTLVMGLVVPGLALWLLNLLHKGRIRLASVIMTSTLFLLTTSTIISFRGTRDTASGMYILVIAMAGLLLGGPAAIIFMALSLFASLAIYLAETNGLLNIELSPIPEVIEWVIFATVLLMISILLRFAFATLNRALRQSREANEELENIQASLADRIAARTRDLELAAEIGRYVSGVRESEEILSEAVELIRSRFNLYYAQIYLVDSERRNLRLRAGTGVVGRQLRQLGHRLAINETSINGTAVVQEKSIIVSDTINSQIFRQNPLLPDTRSEMSVPLIVFGTVIGVLNLQSNEVNGLTEDNLPAFEALSGQLAIALDNARLFSESSSAQDALESFANRLTRSGWETYLNAIDRRQNISYTYNLSQKDFIQDTIRPEDNPSFSMPIKLGGETLGKIEVQGNQWDTWQKEQKDLVASVGQRVAQQIENMRLLSETERYRFEAEEASRRLTKEGWESFIDAQKSQPDGYLYDQEQVLPLSAENGHDKGNSLVTDLTVRGEAIGQIEIEDISDSNEEAADLIDAIAERLSAHIENLRLTTQTEIALAETERRAEELAVINELARTVSQQLNLEKILETAYEQVGRILTVDAFIVGLYEQETNLITYPLIYDEGVRYNEGTHYLNKDTSIYEAIKTGESIVVLYDSEEAVPGGQILEQNAIGNEGKASRSMMFVPLIFNNYAVGVISVQSYKLHAYKEADVTLVEGIASHLSVAIQNAQLFEQTQSALAETEEQASRLALLTDLGQALTQAESLEEIYQATAEKAHKIIDSDRASIALISDDGDYYDILALGGMKGSSAVGERQPLEGSSVGQAVKENRLIVVNQTEDSGIRGIYSFMVAPLVSSGRVIGTLNIGSKSINTYGPREERLAVQIATLLATTIESRRLLAQTRERAEELAFVNRIARTISQELDREQMLESILDEISQILPVDAFLIGLYDHDADLMAYPLVYDEGRRYQLESDQPNPESTVSKVLRTQKPVFILRKPKDVEEQSANQPDTMVGNRSKPSASLMYVPLFAGQQIIGVVSVQSYEFNAYKPEDLHLLENISSHVAVALENARLFDESEKRAEELSVVNEVAQTVSGQIEQEELLTTVYGQVRRIMPVDAFSVTAFNPEEKMLNYLMVMDEGKRFEEAPTPLGSGAISRVIKEGQPILINRTKEELDELARKKDLVLIGNVQRFSASMIYVPLQIGSQTIGGMSVQSYELNSYAQPEVEILVGIANHVAVALENARLFKETQKTLTETELLYNMGTQINRAITLEDLVNVVGLPGIAPNAHSAGLFRFELGDDGQAEWMELAANWVGQDEPVLEIGSRLHLPEIPLSAAALYTPNEPMLISDIATDERVDKSAKVLLRGLNTKAMAIIPMQQLETWIGTLIIRWKEPYQFSSREQRLYNSMARQMSTALSNQMLLSETQDRAAQLENITMVETALSQADDEFGIVEALAMMPYANQMISLHYTVEEEKPASAFTVAHWENGEIKQDDKFLNVPFDMALHAGLTLAKEHPDRITYVSDIKSDTRISKAAAKEAKKLGFRSVMIIPLRSAGRWQGFISVKWEEAHNFTAVEASTWEQLREPLAAVVASRRAYEKAEQQAQEARNRSNELVILNEMGRSLTALVDMDTILENIFRYTARLMDAGNFYVAFYDMKRDEITFALDIRGDRVMRNTGTRKAGKGLTEHIINSKEPLLISENVDGKLDELGIEKIGPSAASWLGAPLMVGSQVIGVIALQNWETPQAYTEQHLRLLTSVAGQAAIAIENARLFEQIQARARRERILREVTAKVRGASDADSVMRTAVQEIGKALGRRTFVYLNQNHQYETELTKEEAYGD